MVRRYHIQNLLQFSKTKSCFCQVAHSILTTSQSVKMWFVKNIFDAKGTTNVPKNYKIEFHASLTERKRRLSTKEAAIYLSPKVIPKLDRALAGIIAWPLFSPSSTLPSTPFAA